MSRIDAIPDFNNRSTFLTSSRKQIMGLMEWFFGPPTLDQFAKTLQQKLRRAGDNRRTRYEPQNGHILLSGKNRPVTTVKLNSLFREFSSLDRKNRKGWMRRTVTALINRIDMPEDFEEVKPDLYPAVTTRAMSEFLRLQADSLTNDRMDFTIAESFLSEFLVVGLVYDHPHSFQLINNDCLKAWGVTLNDALEVARKNLNERPFSTDRLDGGLYAIAHGDGFDATRMLLIDVISRLEVSGDPIAMPVTRELLLITGTEDEKGLEQMVALAQKEAKSPRPICSIPHILKDEGWAVWIPPKTSSVSDGFHFLAAKNMERLYAEQKSLMDQMNKRDRVDACVSMFLVGEQKAISLSALGEKDVATWLPKSDLVGLVNMEVEWVGHFQWTRFEEVMGESMTPMDCYPPRWIISKFPNSDQLRSLGESWTG